VLEVRHGIIAHGRSAGRCQRIVKAGWAASTARVIRQGVAAASVA
jgi:hypothetical protein